MNGKPAKAFHIGWIILLAALAGCNPSPAPPPDPPGQTDRLRNPNPSAVQSHRIIVAFGDSLTAGMGIPAHQSYPAQLEKKLQEQGYPYRVINMGISGDTTAGGLRRLQRVLDIHPEIVILELGANDGLRGLALDPVRENLNQMIRRMKDAGIQVILAGMELPFNYGPKYTTNFARLYGELAQAHEIPLIPFFLEGVAGRVDLNQDDGLHPTAKGYGQVVGNIWSILLPLLHPPVTDGSA